MRKYLMDKNKITLEERCSIFATGNYTHDLPVNWTEFNDDEQYKFIETHQWQPFENWPTDDVVSEIVNLQDKVESLLKNTLNLTTLEKPEIPLFFVEIAIRHGDFTENVKSIRQAENKESAIKMAIEGASRCELEWADDEVPVAYDCGSQISLSYMSCKQVKSEHIGILKLYLTT